MWEVRLSDPGTGESYVIHAEDVSFTDMPLVYIRGIRKEYRSTTIIIPDPDPEIWQDAAKFEPLIVPFHTIIHAGKIKDETQVRKLVGLGK